MSRQDAYRIIKTEAKMISGVPIGGRPTKVTIRWLKEAIELLEQVVKDEEQ